MLDQFKLAPTEPAAIHGQEDQKIAACGSSYIDRVHRQYRGRTKIPAGAAAGCDLLILIFDNIERAEDQDQKIAACGSSYRPSVSSPAALDLDPPAPSEG
ncbi:hypothetical protein [Pseudomonas sp. B1(2018)]|uniref:hypothetical protein n=1 Tax=Pseudomonas sp. B1(2018) TaxID=2233856 RepID=UPI001401F708|nr:hypothetical protein [Pseudomonas sp. B1(2018)]